MKKIFLITVTTAIALAACKKKTDGTSTPDQYADQKNQVKATYADLAFAVYDDALVDAVELQTAIHNFVDNPTQSGFENAKTKWLESRESYGQSEVFRFAEGPIDNITDGPEGLINSWPLDEAYIDYVQNDANAGIINKVSTFPTIDASLLVNANTSGGETNISTGYHAIEFLLWGQDLYANSAGQRPYTDYVTDGSGTHSNQVRRGTYLTVVTDLLVDALTQVRNAWDPAGTNNYRSTWLAMSNADVLHKMFNSLIVLSGDELSGERIRVAYDNEDQEDEHSCFSDNTHRDLALNAQGMYNLYTGTYVRTDGTTVQGYSISDLITAMVPAHNTQMISLLDASKLAISNIEIPFDQAIINDRPDVLAAINALVAESDYFHTIATSDLHIVL